MSTSHYLISTVVQQNGPHSNLLLFFDVFYICCTLTWRYAITLVADITHEDSSFIAHNQLVVKLKLSRRKCRDAEY